MNITLYTAIYGEGYDRPKSLAGVPNNVKRVLFTDISALEAPGWEVRFDPLSHLPSPMLRSKMWKCLSHEALPDTDIAIWIDGSITPLAGFTANAVNKLGTDELALTQHPLRDCIYAEREASAPLPKYNAEAMRLQIEMYAGEGHPAHWGLFASGITVRRHTRTIERFNKDWWDHNRLYSWQDQLSLPVLVKRHADENGLLWNSKLLWAEHWGHTEHYW